MEKIIFILGIVFLISLYAVNAIGVDVINTSNINGNTGNQTTWNVSITVDSGKTLQRAWMDLNASHNASSEGNASVYFGGVNVLAILLAEDNFQVNHGVNLLNSTCVSGNCPTKTTIGHITYSQFDGVNDLIQIADNEQIDNYGTDLTSYCTGIWNNGGGNSPRLMAKGGTTSSFEMRFQDTTQCAGSINCMQRILSTSTTSSGTSNIVRNGELYDFALTSDYDAISRMYLNGIADANTTSTTGNIANSTDDLRVGQDNELHISGWFPGNLKMCVLYNNSGLQNQFNKTKFMTFGYYSNESNGTSLVFHLNFTDNVHINTSYYRICANQSDGGVNCTSYAQFGALPVIAVAASDTTPPIVNTSFNSSSPNNLMSVFNFTGNVTDETGLLSANWTYNISGFITKINYTLSGTSAQVSNTTSLLGLSGNSVINFTLYVTDTSNNVKQNSTLITIADVILPIVNASFNISSLNILLFSTINFSANITDETGLLFANITYNMSIDPIEIGRYAGDGITPADFGAVNTSGLVLLMHFNNETGENNSLVKDFSVDVNSQMTVNNNGTCSGTSCPVYNFSDKKFGNGAMRFDGVNQFINITNLQVDKGSGANNTVSFWMYFIGKLSDNRVPLGFKSYNLQMVDGCFGFNTVNSENFGYSPNGTNITNRWVNVVAQFSNGVPSSNNVKLYIDGIQQNLYFCLGTSSLSRTINETMQISGFNDNPNFRFNGSIDEIAIWNRSLSAYEILNLYKRRVTKLNSTISGTSANFYNVTNITVGRSSVINFTMYATDTSNNVKQNSTLITISNTVPPVTLVSNASDNNQKTNVTYNITSVTDVDNDGVNYIVRFEAINPPTVIIYNGTLTNFTTNMTNETTYFIRIDTFDNFDTTIGTTIFNTTIDTGNIIWQQDFIANGSFYKTSTNITYNCTDINIFEVNTSFARTTGAILLNQSFINLTPSAGGSKAVNLTIDTSFGDGNYNGSRWCGDTKNKNKEMPNSVKVGKDKTDKTKNKFNTFVFNDTDSGLQINISILVNKTQLEHPKDNQNLEVNFSLINNDYFKLTIAYDTTIINQTTIVNFTSNNPIIQINDDLSSHLLFGTGKNKLSYDSEDAKNNYTITTIQGTESYIIEFIPINNIPKGNRLIIDPRVDNLNILENSAIIIIDTGLPTFNLLNISRSGLLGNSSFVNQNRINFTFNVSDANNNSILVYLNSLKNVTAGYISNSTNNFTINFTDGNYTMLLQINDSAGNYKNGTLINFVVDTAAPTFVSANNKTTTDNTTNILTNTNVNISIFGLDDLYLNRGNFSHNASGTWTNHTISIIGNATPYYYIIGNGNFTAKQVVGWKFYIYDIAGNELDPIYTFEIGGIGGLPAPSSSFTGGGGGSAAISASTLKQIKEITENYFINSSCDIQVIPKSIILNNENKKEIIQIRYLNQEVINFNTDIISVGDLPSASKFIDFNKISTKLFDKLNITVNLKNSYSSKENTFAGLLLNFSICGKHVIPLTIEANELIGKENTLDNIFDFVKNILIKIKSIGKEFIINFFDITEEFF